MKKLVAFLAMTVFAFVFATAAQASPSEGGSCPKAWKAIKSSASNVLTCVPVANGNAWVIVAATPKKIAAAMTQLDSWKASLGLDSLPDITATVEGGQSVQDLLTVAQQNRDVAAQAVVDTSSAVVAKKAEVDGLPSRIQSAVVISNAANAALKVPKAEYDAASAIVKSLSSSYYSAVANQTALVSAQVLCTFGARPCSSTSSSASSAYASTISQYNVANAMADGAYAKYTSYYNDYKGKYDAYKALVDRSPVANAEYADILAKSQQAAGALPAAEAALSKMHSRIDTLTELAALLNAFNTSQQELDVLLNSSGLQAATNWRTSFAQASTANGRHGLYRNWLTQTWAKYASLAN